MTSSRSLGNQVVAAEIVLQRLLAHASLVGGIYTMAFDECLVLTNDLWKQRVGGLSQHAFLLATAMISGDAPDIEDQEILLLRVIGPAPLPAEQELVQVRAEAMREMVTTHGRQGAVSSPAILDVLTRNEIQFSALRAKVLGTFYEVDVNDQPLLAFGSDLETFYSSSRYKVYKPHGDSLSIIASFPETTEQEELARQNDGAGPRRVRIGSVRYTSTRRRQRLHSHGLDTAVPVRVNVDDFIAMKTAIFGMTRLGKSNTMKTIATAVFQHAAETGQQIGQLLFDPAGEYANLNVQDETALSEIGDEFVIRYRLDTDGTDGFRPLATNYFSDNTVAITWSIVASLLAEHAAKAQYVRDFIQSDIVGPEDPQTPDQIANQKRAQRRRMAFYACLIQAGFDIPEGRTFQFEANQKVRDAVLQELSAENRPDIQPTRQNWLTPQELLDWWKALCQIRHGSSFVTSTQSGRSKEAWVDPQLESILRVLDGSIGTGARVLNAARLFHSVARDTDYAAEIYRELRNGRIVVVDLSRGTDMVQQFCSEHIINYLLARASQRFIAAQEPVSMQIFIEEAHRLFRREKMENIESVDPYVRLAKESAKYQIGLIYATQEVTSVDPIVLANTSNWIVTHLNNHAEIRELSKYYDFADFADLTLRSEDVGFVRLKTRSGRYIVPVQVDRFDNEQVRAARAAALGGQRENGQDNAIH